MTKNWGNQLYLGDNLDTMRRYLPHESVDLVYLDPPFNCKTIPRGPAPEPGCNHSETGHAARLAGSSWGAESERLFEQAVSGDTEGGRGLAALLRMLRSFLGENDMMAHLTIMSARLQELHRVLRPRGSIYLHCDPRASHYLKIIMDALFGRENWRNELIWRRYGPNIVGLGENNFGRVHDTLLFYSKSQDYTWNPLYIPLTPEHIEKTYRHIEPGTGRRFMTTPLTGPGGMGTEEAVFEWRGYTRAWRYSRQELERLDGEGRLFYSHKGYPREKKYLDESQGAPVQSIWDDIKSLSGAHKERLNYPAQKPEALLERVIKASSNPGDVVLDPCCGCGTTIVVAERLQRQWAGIDITQLAITLMKNRLEEIFGGELSPYSVIGGPTTVSEARAWAENDTVRFDLWALGQVAARPAREMAAEMEEGMDGFLTFRDGARGKPRTLMVKVQRGEVHLDQIAALREVMERQGAVIGALITLEEPDRLLRAEAESAGVYEPRDQPGRNYPRLQIRSIRELLEGQGLQYPRGGREATG